MELTRKTFSWLNLSSDTFPEINAYFGKDFEKSVAIFPKALHEIADKASFNEKDKIGVFPFLKSTPNVSPAIQLFTESWRDLIEEILIFFFFFTWLTTRFPAFSRMGVDKIFGICTVSGTFWVQKTSTFILGKNSATNSSIARLEPFTLILSFTKAFETKSLTTPSSILTSSKTPSKNLTFSIRFSLKRDSLSVASNEWIFTGTLR